MPISVRLIHHFFSYSTTDPLNTHQSPPSVNRHPFWTQNLITFPVNPISKLQDQDQNRESGIKLIPPSINFCTFAFLYIFRVEIGSCCWELAKFNLNKTAPFKSPSHSSAATAVVQQASESGVQFPFPTNQVKEQFPWNSFIQEEERRLPSPFNIWFLYFIPLITMQSRTDPFMHPRAMTLAAPP